MPTFVPRGEPTKKKEELALRKQVLENSILNNLGLGQIIKNVEKYREAKLHYNKAVLHVIKEKEFQEKSHGYNKDRILKEIEIWTNKSSDEIVEAVRAKLKNKL